MRNWLGTSIQREALTVGCPHCRAPAGELCKNQGQRHVSGLRLDGISGRHVVRDLNPGHHPRPRPALVRELHAEYSNALEVPRNRVGAILSDLDREQAAQP